MATFFRAADAKICNCEPPLKQNIFHDSKLSQIESIITTERTANSLQQIKGDLKSILKLKIDCNLFGKSIIDPLFVRDGKNMTSPPGACK